MPHQSATFCQQLSLIFPIVVAGILGGIVGYERRRHDKPAGLRTNVLISIGACMFTMVSLGISPESPARIAAQIVSGIGFLGAGAIIQAGGSVHGLTTAAGIWVVAAIGMCCGAGMYFLALVGTLVTMLVLILLPRIENRISSRQQ